MYNFSIKAKVMSGTTVVYPETIYKIQAETLDACKTKMATLLNVQASTIEITGIGYIQEVLTDEE